MASDMFKTKENIEVGHLHMSAMFVYALLFYMNICLLRSWGSSVLLAEMLWMQLHVALQLCKVGDEFFKATYCIGYH